MFLTVPKTMSDGFKYSGKEFQHTGPATLVITAMFYPDTLGLGEYVEGLWLWCLDTGRCMH